MSVEHSWPSRGKRTQRPELASPSKVRARRAWPQTGVTCDTTSSADKLHASSRSQRGKTSAGETTGELPCLTLPNATQPVGLPSGRASWEGPAAAAAGAAEAGAEAEELALAACPSDVMAAILLLKSQFAAGTRASTSSSGAQAARLPPLALKTQLITLLQDRTEMERELDELQRCNAIRAFKLPTGADDYGYLLTADYAAAVRSAAQAAATLARGSAAGQEVGGEGMSSVSRQQQKSVVGAAARRPSVAEQAAEAFCAGVLPACTDTCIAAHKLRSLLLATSAASAAGSSSGGGGSAQLSELQLSALLNMGVLSRHPMDDSLYLLAVPSAGALVKSICAGRAEVCNLLRRRKYGEMPESQLLYKTRLRQSKLSAQFHVRDLLGAGTVTMVPTAGMGNMLRLATLVK